MAGWIAATAIGAGTALYGAKKQSDAVKSSNKAQQAIADETNRLNYQMWLESRGLDKDGRPVNTFLPRWMTVPSGGRPTGWVNRNLTPEQKASPPNFLRRKAAP